MKLASMKLSKKDKKDSYPSTASPSSDGPEYPYCLCLRLDSATLDKLSIDTLPAVGDTMSLEAMGVVTSVSSRESTNNSDRSVEIQIQQLGLDNDNDESDELGDIVKRKGR